MDYLLCMPGTGNPSRDVCNTINNILARMSEKYKLQITPEPVKMKKNGSPEYCKKFRIYKEIREGLGNGEAYLLKEEEEMILSVCKTPEEEQLMRSCMYAYCYPALRVLKSFKDKEKQK